MKFAILILMMISSSVLAAVDLFKQFDARIGGDLDEASRIDSQMKAGLRNGCPQLKSADMSSCFKAQVSGIQVKSAAQLAVLIKAGVNASLYDHSKGYDVEMVKLLLADNMLVTLEKVDTSKFYVNEMTANSRPKKLNKSAAKLSEGEVLLQNEEIALQKLFEESVPVIKEAANGKASSLAEDAAARWRLKTKKALESRLAKLNSNQFKFKN